MYLMEPVKERVKYFDEYAKLQDASNIKLLNYKVYSYEMDPNSQESATVELYYKIEVTDGDTKNVIEKDNVKWNAVKENNIWKIKAEFDTASGN